MNIKEYKDRLLEMRDYVIEYYRGRRPAKTETRIMTPEQKMIADIRRLELERLEAQADLDPDLLPSLRIYPPDEEPAPSPVEITPCVCGGERTLVWGNRTGRKVVCGSCGTVRFQAAWAAPNNDIYRLDEVA